VNAQSDDIIRPLIEGVRKGQPRALARTITLIENIAPGTEKLLAELHPLTGKAQRVGITGPPGAGKSTLVCALVEAYRAREKTVGVIAVDPSSPLTGGALLGDRVRMESFTLDPGVFIRSMATRGAVGGLAITTQEASDVLDAFGFDVVIVETVGVGQSELDVAGSGDTTVLVLVPESGDEVQVLKAGIMEIADIFVVNKSDRPDARLLVTELVENLKLRSDREGDERERWTKPVISTVATTGDGVTQLVETLEKRREYLERTGEGDRRRRDRLVRHARDVTDRLMRQRLWRNGAAEQILERNVDEMASGRLSAYEVARMILGISK
jgi:LAO/AO transport system kinase